MGGAHPEDGDGLDAAGAGPIGVGDGRAYAAATGALGAATAVAWSFHAGGLEDASLVLTYLLAVVAVAAAHGRGPAAYASFGAVLLFNFFFTEPRYTLEVHESDSLFTFAAMLAVGLLVSALMARVREQSRAAQARERRAELLAWVTRELAGATGLEQVVEVARRLLAEILRVDVVVRVDDDPSRPRASARGVEPAGAGALELPLMTPDGAVGTLVVRSDVPGRLAEPEARRLLETFAAQLALAIQRDRLAAGIRRARAQAEAEELRSALLSCVSHDLRTPLAAIAGASSSLLEAGGELAAPVERELLQTIYDEADRLGRLVEDLLQMTSIAAGRLEVRKEWHVVEDVVGSALARSARRLAGHPVIARLPEGLPLLSIDGVLVEQALINLLENAAKYAPPATPIEVSARVRDGRLRLEVADRGPGVPDAEKERVFEKFYRGATGRARGAGLGLTICRAIAQLHAGSVHVEDHEGGGARFCLELPLEEQPPAISEMAAASAGAPDAAETTR